MTTYEEDLVDIYYNLNDYFTIKNIYFPAKERRKGGKGRGEIDLLAVKVSDNKIVDAIRVEVGVGLADKFPFVTKDQADEPKKIIRKFFESDADYKIKSIIGNTKYSHCLICSDFHRNAVQKLKDKLEELGSQKIKIAKKNEQIDLTLSYDGIVKKIRIIEFSFIKNEILRLFIKNELINRNFQDSRMRECQHFVNYVLKSMVSRLVTENKNTEEILNHILKWFELTNLDDNQKKYMKKIIRKFK